MLTWSENERVAGVRAAQPPLLAADSELLAWLERRGVALPDGAEVVLGGIKVRARGYKPIPWATPQEAVRKVWSAVRNPALARERMRFTRKRPSDPPYALRLTLDGWTVAYLHQALHRFQDERALKQILRLADGADVVIAGTDYDDEKATAAALAHVGAPHLVLVDVVGPVRRKLGLPVRDLEVCRAAAPERTVCLGAELTFPG